MGVQEKIAAFEIVSITDHEGFAQRVGLGRFPGALNGCHRCKAEGPELGDRLESEQATALAAAPGGELGPWQGKGNVAGINALEYGVLFAAVGDLHVVFPLEIVLAILMYQYGHTVSDSPFDIEPLGLVHIEFPILVGPEIGEALGLVLEHHSALDSHIAGDTERHPLAGDIRTDQFQGAPPSAAIL